MDNDMDNDMENDQVDVQADVNYWTDAVKGKSVNFNIRMLEPWLNDEEITEICVNRPNEVFVERNSKWERYPVAISYDECLSLGVSVAAYSNNELSVTRPVLSAVLPKGQRIQVVIPSACEDGTISITIRKPSFIVRTLDMYKEQNFFGKIRPEAGELSEVEYELLMLQKSKDYAGFMRRAVQSGKVIVVSGETGSGKTTFMRALMEEIPKTMRLVTIEDVPELFLPNHANHVHLFYPSEARAGDIVTSASLLKCCLRMKPDRILLAELRGAEAFDFINVCASGHAGSITSCHAGNAELTFERLAMMCLQNPQGQSMNFEEVKRLLYMVVDVVVHVHANALYGRHITEIWYDPEAKFRRKGVSSQGD